MIPAEVEAARSMIREGFCPWCGAGPFKVPVGHITRVHDLNRWQVRDELGFFYQDSLTDPGYNEERVNRSRRQFLAGKSGIHAFKAGTSKTLSEAARRMQKEKAHLITDEMRGKIARDYGDKRLAEARVRDDRIIHLAAEGWTNARIAREMGVHVRTVWVVLRRNDQPPTARVRYAKSRKGVYASGLAKGNELHRIRMAEDAAQLVKDYQRGVTVYDLAARRGTAVKAVRARLRKLGVFVPDGRADPERPQRGSN